MNMTKDVSIMVELKSFIIAKYENVTDPSMPDNEMIQQVISECFNSNDSELISLYTAYANQIYNEYVYSNCN